MHAGTCGDALRIERVAQPLRFLRRAAHGAPFAAYLRLLRPVKQPPRLLGRQPALGDDLRRLQPPRLGLHTLEPFGLLHGKAAALDGRLRLRVQFEHRKPPPHFSFGHAALLRGVVPAQKPRLFQK